MSRPRALGDGDLLKAPQGGRGQEDSLAQVQPCPWPGARSSLSRPPGSSYFRYAESSMKNSFGLKYLHKFFNIPFLQLQVSPARLPWTGADPWRASLALVPIPLQWAPTIAVGAGLGVPGPSPLCRCTAHCQVPHLLGYFIKLSLGWFVFLFWGVVLRFIGSCQDGAEGLSPRSTLPSPCAFVNHKVVHPLPKHTALSAQGTPVPPRTAVTLLWGSRGGAFG